MEAGWPPDAPSLVALQEELGASSPLPYVLPPGAVLAGGCFICFGRGGEGSGQPGDIGWAGAVLMHEGTVAAEAVASGRAGAGYEPGLLALREGPLLEAAVRALPRLPEVLLVNATGRDHPRRAGLALHLGAVVGVPTVGVTHRTLLAGGDWPPDRRGATSPLEIDEDVVGYWLRTVAKTRPLGISAGWRTTPELAVEIVLALKGDSRTPEPIRLARQAARTARAQAEGGSSLSQ